MKRTLAALVRSPWLLAALAAVGTTLLVPSAFALLAPPDLLDAAVALGDRRLTLCVALLFAAALGIARLALWRRRSPEEDVAEQAASPAVHGAGHLR